MVALRMIHDESPAAYDESSTSAEVGFVIIPAVFRTISGPTDIGDGKKPIAKGVLVGVYQAIASYANTRTRVSRPSLKTISDDTGWSEDLVTRAVRALAKLEIIRIERREINGFNQSNQYVLVRHFAGTKPTAPSGILDAKSGKSANERIPLPAGAHPLVADQAPAHSGLGTRSQRYELDRQELDRQELDIPPTIEDKPFDVIEAICEAQGQTFQVIPNSDRGKHCKIAEGLLADGINAKDAGDIVRWLKATWVKDGVDVFLVKKQAANWRLAGSPDGVTVAKTKNTNHLGLASW